MERRQLLAVVGGTAIAGCLGGAPSEDDAPEEEEGESPEGGENDGGQEPTVDVTVSDVAFAERELPGGRSETAATGFVENTGDTRLGLVTATGKFYDSEGRLLSSSLWDIRDLEPGEVWEPWLAYSGDGQRVDEAEIVVTDTAPYGRTVWPKGFDIQSRDVQIPADDFASPRVIGTVANESGSDASLLQARMKLYDKNDTLLETGIASIQNFGAGETWSFDKQVYFANGSWIGRTQGFKVVLTA